MLRALFFLTCCAALYHSHSALEYDLSPATSKIGANVLVACKCKDANNANKLLFRILDQYPSNGGSPPCGHSLKRSGLKCVKTWMCETQVKDWKTDIANVTGYHTAVNNLIRMYETNSSTNGLFELVDPEETQKSSAGEGEPSYTSPCDIGRPLVESDFWRKPSPTGNENENKKERGSSSSSDQQQQQQHRLEAHDAAAVQLTSGGALVSLATATFSSEVMPKTARVPTSSHEDQILQNYLISCKCKDSTKANKLIFRLLDQYPSISDRPCSPSFDASLRCVQKFICETQMKDWEQDIANVPEYHTAVNKLIKMHANVSKDKLFEPVDPREIQKSSNGEGELTYISPCSDGPPLVESDFSRESHIGRRTPSPTGNENENDKKKERKSLLEVHDAAVVQLTSGGTLVSLAAGSEVMPKEARLLTSSYEDQLLHASTVADARVAQAVNPGGSALEAKADVAESERAQSGSAAMVAEAAATDVVAKAVVDTSGAAEDNHAVEAEATEPLTQSPAKAAEAEATEPLAQDFGSGAADLQDAAAASPRSDLGNLMRSVLEGDIKESHLEEMYHLPKEDYEECDRVSQEIGIGLTPVDWEEGKLLNLWPLERKPDKRGGDAEVLNNLSWAEILRSAVEGPERESLKFTRLLITNMFAKALRFDIVEVATVEKVFTNAILDTLFVDEDPLVRWAAGTLICEWRTVKADYILKTVELLKRPYDERMMPEAAKCHFYAKEGRSSSDVCTPFDGQMPRMMRRLFGDDDDGKKGLKKAPISRELDALHTNITDQMMLYLKEARMAARKLSQAQGGSLCSGNVDYVKFQKLWIGFEAMNSFKYIQFDVYEHELEADGDLGSSIGDFSFYVRQITDGLCNMWSAETKCHMKMDLACERMQDSVGTVDAVLKSLQSVKERAKEAKRRMQRDKADAEFRKNCFIMVVLFGCACIVGIFQYERMREMKPLWRFSSRKHGKLQWKSEKGFDRAELPKDSLLYHRIVQLVEDYGGRMKDERLNCSADSSVSIKSIDIIRNERLITQFETSVNIKEEEQKTNRTGIFRKSDAEVIGDDEQKRKIMARAKTHLQRSATLLNEDCDGPVSLYVTLHGCAKNAVDSICELGAKDLRRTDPGYAGAGIYTTIQAEYAAMYSKMNSGDVIILCCCAASNIYPISRSMDYAHPHDSEYYYSEGDAAHSRFYDEKHEDKGGGMALKSGFDAHWFCVTQPEPDTLRNVECYVPGDDRFPPCYDELVVKEQNQVLPIAVIHID